MIGNSTEYTWIMSCYVFICIISLVMEVPVIRELGSVSEDIYANNRENDLCKK